MSIFQSKNFTLFSGNSKGFIDALISFDMALIDAGVGNYNLVKVSSIRPPHFQQSDCISVPDGEILFSAYASLTEKGAGIISAALSIGIPIDEANIGVIMEYSCHDKKSVAAKKAEEMVASAMKTRGIAIREIIVASIETELIPDSYSTVVVGAALW
jgi:arginine decarboxylase